MKTTLKVLGLSLAMAAIVLPVYAEFEAGMVPAGKTLIDFQRDLSARVHRTVARDPAAGTKPIVRLLKR